MAETYTFLPKRTPGIILHAFLAAMILGGFGLLVWLAFQQTGGFLLILYLFGSIVLLGIVPFVGYRGYALLHGVYSLKRDGLRVRWGLRSEDIPLSEVKWVRPANDLQTPLRFPAFSIPGAILGTVDHLDLGPVEFIASSYKNLVVVASINQVIAVSPENVDEFVQRFQRAIEMGTLTPMEAYSSVPAAFLRQVAADRYVRILIPSGFGLTMVLLVLVSLSVPGIPLVSLGYDLSGNLLQPVESVRMLLLPVLSTIFYIFSLVAGLYFYRRSETRPISYLVWTGGMITPILLIAASIILLVSAL